MRNIVRMGRCKRRAARFAAALLALATLAACSGNEQLAASRPDPEAAAPTPSATPTPPPVDLSGRWKLTAASGGSCFMTFGSTPGSMQGTIAPAGGCPGNFFTSRKWTFDHGALIIHDHKGATLAELSFAGGHFEGHEANGGAALSLSR